MCRYSSFLVLSLLCLQTAPLSAAEWGRFRGPNGTGVAADGALVPIEFGPGQNVVWEKELPPGHSSPILADDRLFLTAFDDEKLLTFAIDRTTGAELWRREAPRERVTAIDDRNNAASPSPAVGEDGVFVFFADYGLVAYDFEGNERWRHPLGPFRNVYGMGASPILAEGKVILVCDQSTHSYLLALDQKTGEVAWRTERPESSSGHSTPVLYRGPGGRLEVLVPGSFYLTSYAVSSGEKLWWVSGLSFEMKSTPVIAGDMIYVNGYGAPENQPGSQIEAPSFEQALAASDANRDGRLGGEELTGHARSWFSFTDRDGDGALDEAEWQYYEASLASQNGILGIRVGGEGDVTDENVVWRYHRSVPQLPSPLLYDGVLYMVNDGGIVTTLDPETGEAIAQGRLKGAVDHYFASPVAAGGKIFFVSELGKVAVVEPGGELEVVKVNDLDDLVYATPAIEDGRIYLRTRHRLYCFGERSGRGAEAAPRSLSHEVNGGSR